MRFTRPGTNLLRLGDKRLMRWQTLIRDSLLADRALLHDTTAGLLDKRPGTDLTNSAQPAS